MINQEEGIGDYPLFCFFKENSWTIRHSAGQTHKKKLAQVIEFHTDRRVRRIGCIAEGSQLVGFAECTRRMASAGLAPRSLCSLREKKLIGAGFLRNSAASA